jgi:hypothetical protein
MDNKITAVKMDKVTFQIWHLYQLYPQIQFPSSQSTQLFQADFAALQSVPTARFSGQSYSRK